MKKHQPIKITIPQPCSEKWSAMPAADKGRFCENCKKAVVDFSGLSDRDLYMYIAKTISVPCGRFHKDQLNKPLLYSSHRKPFVQSFYKIAAAFIAFFGFKQSVIASQKLNHPFILTPERQKLIEGLSSPKIKISGTVKDASGNWLENAEIAFDGKIVSRTDNSGKFEFEIDIQSLHPNKSFLILIGYPGLNTVVRSYHPAMMNTSYDVMLFPPSDGSSFFMGIPAIEEYFPVTIIGFRRNDKTFSADARTVLSTLAVKMRNNPPVSIEIVATNKPSEATTGKKIQTAIKTCLVNEEGISEDRIIFTTESGNSQKPYTIEIRGRRD